MEWNIPGTVLTVPIEETECIPEKLTSMFLGGGMVLSQVAAVTGLEPYTIQNWVKRGFLSPPQHKRYDMEQVCRIININLLRSTLPLEQITGLMAYLNGDLTDESDDLVDDTQLYFLFVRLAARARYIGGGETWDDALVQATADYREPIPGAREKLMKVLKIMLTAWVAGRIKAEAERMIGEL